MSIRAFLSDLLSILSNQVPTTPVELSFATSSIQDTIEEDGVWIGRRRRGGRFVLYPDGQLRQVDRDFDTSVFSDPDSLPACEATTTVQTDAGEMGVPDVDPAPDCVQAIAQALLSTSPTALVAIYHDAKGKVLGSTVTPAKRGLTPAVFRAAFRSLPTRAKQVTFAASGNVASDVRDAATMAADAFLVRVLDFISG